MKIEDLCGSELYIAGSMMCRLVEEFKKQATKDENAEKAMKYIIFKLDEINKEIAEKALEQTTERMDRIRETILGKDK